MPMFSRGDVDLYYECHGGGAPLLLVAGLASDSQSWQPFRVRLDERSLTRARTDTRSRRDRGLVVSDGRVQDVRSPIPQSKFAAVTGAAHSIHLEYPTPFVECVLDFLKPRATTHAI